MFLDGEGEGEEHLDILLDVFGGEFVEFGIFEDPGGVEAEVDADVAVLIEAGVVELGAEAEDADGGGFEGPGGLQAFCAVGDRGCPETPLHLELIGHVFVELLCGFGDGVLDERVGGVFGAGVVDVDALVGGRFGEADRVDGGGGDAALFADEGELAQHGDERGGKRFKAKVREPEAQV